MVRNGKHKASWMWLDGREIRITISCGVISTNQDDWNVTSHYYKENLVIMSLQHSLGLYTTAYLKEKYTVNIDTFIKLTVYVCDIVNIESSYKNIILACINNEEMKTLL